MAAGIQLTGAQIQNTVGNVANDFLLWCHRFDDLEGFKDRTSGTWVAAYGLSQADTDALVSAITTLKTMVAAFRADANAVFVERVRGIGVG